MDDHSTARGGYRRASDETWARARRDYEAGHTGVEVCARHDLRPSTLRDRARAEGWRRMDAPTLDHGPEPVDLDSDEALELPDYEEMALVALIRVNRALQAGRAAEAASWMRLHEKLDALAERPDPEPAPPPPRRETEEEIKARQARIEAGFARMPNYYAHIRPPVSDNSDTVFSAPDSDPLPPRDGEGGRREATAGWGGLGEVSADGARLSGTSGAAWPAPPPPASPAAQPPPRGGEGQAVSPTTAPTPPRSPPPAAP
ncbi:MAG: hypothetical protein ACK4FB_10740 [Brevundimonas sp.]|uniref:hypothetical protein n=1 Tax=Brevundimonas sp. TaxID=1871086 RepID=UPI003918D06E